MVKLQAPLRDAGLEAITVRQQVGGLFPKEI
jgi:hypothetical protein